MVEGTVRCGGYWRSGEPLHKTSWRGVVVVVVEGWRECISAIVVDYDKRRGRGRRCELWQEGWR